jgi:putative flippase GtrA
MRFGHIPRYVLVGGFCAGLYNVFMIGADWLGLGYVAATVVAFGLLVLIGYGLHCRFTFTEPMTLRGFVRYTAAMLLTLPLSLAVMFVLKGLIHLPMWLASPLLTVIMFAWNFLATRWAVVTRVLIRKKAAPGEAPS